MYRTIQVSDLASFAISIEYSIRALAVFFTKGFKGHFKLVQSLCSTSKGTYI